MGNQNEEDPGNEEEEDDEEAVARDIYSLNIGISYAKDHNNMHNDAFLWERTDTSGADLKLNRLWVGPQKALRVYYSIAPTLYSVSYLGCVC